MKLRLLFASLSVMLAHPSIAQFKVGQNIVGTPYDARRTAGFVGDAYLYPDWKLGHVLQEDGKYFNNMSLKYDINNDQVIFNSNGHPMAFKFPVKEFQIIHKKSLQNPIDLFKNGFPSVGKYTRQSYYQVLADGQTALVKKPYKAIIESIPYGESEKKKTFVASELYFIYHNGEMIKFKKSKNDLLNILSDKKSELTAFIKDKNLSMKIDKDYATVIDYYNSLK